MLQFMIFHSQNVKMVIVVRSSKQFEGEKNKNKNRIDFFRFLAATVFRPGGARRAFPCFDEPHLRAPFHVSLFRDRFHIGLSNSIVYATEDLGFYMGVGLVSTYIFN